MNLLEDHLVKGACRGLMSTSNRVMVVGEATVLRDCEGQSRNDKLSRLPSIRVSLS